MKIQKYKHNGEYSYTLGMSLTIELLLAKPEFVETVYINSNTEDNDNLLYLKSLCENNNIPIEKSDKIFNILSPKGNCFVIGVFRKFKSVINIDSHIVLVNPSDAGNFGTIIRTAAGFCINNIAVIKPAVDIFDPKAIRSSMGAFCHINFEYFDDINDYRSRFGSHKLYAFMLDAKNDLQKTQFIEPYSLVFGNEAAGLSDEYANFCETVIIPHSKKIDSLNLTVAAGIAMYSATMGKWDK